MLMCRCVGHIVTDVNNHRDTEMLMCRRVSHIVTDVNNHRDTEMFKCRRVGHIVTDGNNHRDNPSTVTIRPPWFFLMFIFRFRIARGGASISI